MQGGFVLALILFTFGCALAPKPNSSNGTAAETPPMFKVEITDLKDLRICNLNFTGPLPSSPTVDRVLRQAVEKAVKENAKKDILAKAWVGNEELTRKQYSGGLVYKASTKKIITLDEFQR